MTRPEISFDVSEISSRINSATIVYIKRVNKLMKFLKTTPNSILIPSINIDKSFIAGFSDASFGKLHNGGSQWGDILFLVDDEMRAAVLSCSSNRLKRVVRSTLSAETLQFCNTADTGFFLNSLLSEIFAKRVMPSSQQSTLLIRYPCTNKRVLTL